MTAVIRSPLPPVPLFERWPERAARRAAAAWARWTAHRAARRAEADSARSAMPPEAVWLLERADEVAPTSPSYAADLRAAAQAIAETTRAAR